ncbi:50S ribosomal protein L32 [Oscillospiraceae bacterium HV4-5-C5C]|nr:50S ribosomal protein L32 [Oscillospiraceae bacterium]MDD4369198.1 50S ribosomal protein L32 [Oscillospiraceae bacterium]NJP40937.1 50S ribosomal protein L32 [Oscillospiraceae bacterium HV4-5-C5C]
MAVPKSRWSKARSHRSRSNWKVAAPTLTECPKCHQLMQPHRACKACGFYQGREVVKVGEAQ